MCCEGKCSVTGCNEKAKVGGRCAKHHRAAMSAAKKVASLVLLALCAPLSAQVIQPPPVTATAVGTAKYCADAGATDAYACSLPVTPTVAAGLCVNVKANTANTGAASLNLNSTGAVTIVKVAGGVTTTLADNDIRAGQVITVCHDGTNFELQSTLGNAAAGGSGITVGSTTITSGTSTRVPYNNAGVYAESANLTNSGSTVTVGTGISGTSVALVVDNATSTGNSLTVNDGGVQSFAVRDGGDMQCLTSGTNRCIFHYGGASAGYGFATGFEGAVTNSMYVRAGLYTGANSAWLWYDVNADLAAFGFQRGPNNTGTSSARAAEVRLNANYDLREWDTSSTGAWSRDFVKNAPVALSEGSATAIATISIASGDYGSAWLYYTTYASDATPDHQERDGWVKVSIVNKGGTETCKMTSVAGIDDASVSETEDGSGAGAISTGTLTTAVTLDTTGTNQCVVKISATSSLTQTTLQTVWSARLNGKLTIQ